MTARYLLSCTCGKSIEVDISKAGDVVVCPCGNQLDVPPLRKLRELPPAEETPFDDRPIWGVRQSVTLLGLLIFLFAVSIGAILYWNLPAAPQQNIDRALAQLESRMETITPWESWRLWNEVILPRGLVERRSPGRAAYEKRLRRDWGWIHTAWAIAGSGLVLSLVAAVWKPAPKRAAM